MAEREADRAHPDRLLAQAVAALLSDACREISPDFRRRLREHDAAPSLFGANDLAAVARTGVEAEIARSIDGGHGIRSTDGVRDALRRRGEGYAREQKCERAVAVRAIATMVEFARLADAPDSAVVVQREARLIDSANPTLAQAKLLRLLKQHRAEWSAFMSSLPERSWVREIVGQL